MITFRWQRVPAAVAVLVGLGFALGGHVEHALLHLGSAGDLGEMPIVDGELAEEILFAISHRPRSSDARLRSWRLPRWARRLGIWWRLRSRALRRLEREQGPFSHVFIDAKGVSRSVRPHRNAGQDAVRGPSAHAPP